jgi:hypothetical protein
MDNIEKRIREVADPLIIEHAEEIRMSVLRATGIGIGGGGGGAIEGYPPCPYCGANGGGGHGGLCPGRVT